MSTIPALERLRQEDCKFKATLALPQFLKPQNKRAFAASTHLVD
jgi:hypothetical protein